MGIRRIEDVVAFQQARLLKEGVYVLVAKSPGASLDWRWRAQLFDAVMSVESNIAEGWARQRAGEMTQFLRYAHGSLDETWRRLTDGVSRGFYPAASLEPLRHHERLCGASLRRLRTALERSAGLKRRF